MLRENERPPIERFRALEQTVNGQLTLQDNALGQVTNELRVTGSTEDLIVRLDDRIRRRPLSVRVLEIRVRDTALPGSYGGSVQWSYASANGIGYVRILNFPGLHPDLEYAVRLFIEGG